MPNHVINRLRVTGPEKDVDRFVKRAIQTGENPKYPDELYFDFNQFIPMPDDIRHAENSSSVTTGLALHGYVSSTFSMGGVLRNVGKAQALGAMLEYPWAKEAGITTWQEMEARVRKDDPSASGKGRKAIENFEKYGFTDWYGWSVKYWGTKWGAYEYFEVERSEGVFECTFNTAWSDPEPIYEAMELRFPTLQFEVTWFDEGHGHAGERVRQPNKDVVVLALDNPDVETDPKALELYIRAYGESPDFDEEMVS